MKGDGYSWLGGSREVQRHRRNREHRKTSRKPKERIRIVPVKVISALRGGKAAEILEQIARPNGTNPTKTPRDFGPWKTIGENVSMCVGTIAGQRKILQLGERHSEGLFLDDVPGKDYSLKPDLKKGKRSEIGIGKDMESDRYHDVANNIAVVWGVKGGIL